MKLSPFGGLPAELRNRIYELALTRDEPIILVVRNIDGVHSVQRCDAQIDSEPNLFRTCKTIYAEAKSVFYGNNTFELLARPENVAELLDIFLQKTTTMRNLLLLRNVNVNVGAVSMIRDDVQTIQELTGILHALRGQRIWLPDCRFALVCRAEHIDEDLRLEFRSDNIEESTAECLMRVSQAKNANDEHMTMRTAILRPQRNLRLTLASCILARLLIVLPEVLAALKKRKD